MLKDRDFKLIQFLNEFKVASTTALWQMFYAPSSKRIAQKRLKYMFDGGELNRSREHIDNEFVYYTGKEPPKQLRHQTLLTSFYGELCELSRKNPSFKIRGLQKESDLIEGIRPDGLLGFEILGRKYVAFIEVEISNNSISRLVNKYRDCLENERYKEYFKTFPLIIVISNKYIPDLPEFSMIKINEDLSNIKDILFMEEEIRLEQSRKLKETKEMLLKQES